MLVVNEIITPSQILKAKLSDYLQLVKVRLSLLVVFSASMAYLWASNRNVDTLTIWLLSIGGFLVTASANVFNQIIEKDSDKFMKRTTKRPLPNGRMKTVEAFVLAITLGVLGLVILSRINFLSAILGASAIILYACVYTPLKKITPLTVIPGAIAGSLPVVIGWVAHTGTINYQAGILFLIQFIWQFPHTWSIAWLLDEEYNKAGIKMLPTAGGRNKISAIIIMLSTFLIIPAAFLLYMYESAGIPVTFLLIISGMILLLFSYKLYRSRTEKSAIGLMLSSFAYLPFVLIILVIEKFL